MEVRVADALVAIRRIVRAAEFSARELAEVSGLTPSQFLVLQILYRGETGAGEIARATRLSQGTVTTLLDKLEAAKLIQRRRLDEDKRRVQVQVTLKGRKIVERAPNALQDTFAAKFQRLADWEQAAMVAALERVCALLDAGAIDASPVLDVGALDRSLAPREPPPEG